MRNSSKYLHLCLIFFFILTIDIHAEKFWFAPEPIHSLLTKIESTRSELKIAENSIKEETGIYDWETTDEYQERLHNLILSKTAEQRNQLQHLIEELTSTKFSLSGELLSYDIQSYRRDARIWPIEVQTSLAGFVRNRYGIKAIAEWDLNRVESVKDSYIQLEQAANSETLELRLIFNIEHFNEVLTEKYVEGCRYRIDAYQLELFDKSVGRTFGKISEVPLNTILFSPERVIVRYKVGDTGPSGGYVIRDKGYDRVSERYVEAHRRKVATGGQRGAENYCAELSKNGFSDWRLPSTRELRKIASMAQKFGDYEIDRAYWAKNRYESVYLTTGTAVNTKRTKQCYIVPVRDF
ncbi:MAG: hypothetical protein ACOCZA_01430 [Spirochaetota bacterium]